VGFPVAGAPLIELVAGFSRRRICLKALPDKDPGCSEKIG
jgi:hypothetical protein